MKVDLRISIKDYGRDKSLKVQLPDAIRPAATLAPGVDLAMPNHLHNRVRRPSSTPIRTNRELMKSHSVAAPVLLRAILSTMIFGNPAVTQAADTYVPFDGEKSAWHDGF